MYFTSKGRYHFINLFQLSIDLPDLPQCVFGETSFNWEAKISDRP